MSKYYKKIPAIKVTQPLGTFYSLKFSASELKKLTFSARARYGKHSVIDSIFGGMTGTQRELNKKREMEIGRFIDSTECAFPNSVIIGANVDSDGRFVTKYDERWRVEKINDDFYYLIIPTDTPLASIIDGQHRLSGFDQSDRDDMELLCSVYLDLPAPYQAYLFASININQKKVDKSLAYELYGFSLNDEERGLWSPEKLSVYLARSINFREGPLEGKIQLGAEINDTQDESMVSLSTIVDGILTLITSNPKKDRDDLLNYKNKDGRKGLDLSSTYPPLRKKYIDMEDDYIEKVIFDFIEHINDVFFSKLTEHSYITKTVGFIGLFGFLKEYLKQNNGEYETSDFLKCLSKSEKIDFSNSFYSASGLGASRIKNSLLIAAGLKTLDSFEGHRDLDLYKELVPIPN